MLGGRLNEDKMTRSMKVEIKKTYEDKDFELGSRRNYGLCENKENSLDTFSSDYKKELEFRIMKMLKFM